MEVLSAPKVDVPTKMGMSQKNTESVIILKIVMKLKF